MASIEEDNNLLCISKVNSPQEVDIVNVYKKLEHVLNNKTESFPNKVESLIQVWKQVSDCRLTEQKQYIVQLMDWLKLHTLNIVLTGDWKKVKDTFEERLLKEVKHCEMLLLHSNNIFSLRCRKLAEVIKDPWGNPVLNKLLNNADVNVGSEEIEFFSMETGYLISTRLRKLCESHCEDLALNLVTAFMRCHQMSEVQHFNLNATEDQKRFILDVYIALLYKYKKTTLIVSTLKSLSLREGLDLLQRFVHKRVNISKIWKHSNRIAHLAAQVYVTATIMKTEDENLKILVELLDTWFSLHEINDNLDTLTATIRRIIQAADSAIHVYLFCEAVYKRFGVNMKTFTIELYIRALTTDMNDLERQKIEEDNLKVPETTKRLALGFLHLADILEEHIKVSRECVLTSFSLLPTRETLERIIKLAESSGYAVLDTGQTWKCKLHPPASASDDICWKCDLCGDYMSQPQIESPSNTNTALSEALSAEHLGLSPQLCDDLAVILSSPRYQLFNWLLPWKDLHRLCVLYLSDPERTKNFVTELKFLDIDYSVYMSMKREPEDEEITGIERGYEHFLEEDLYPEERVTSSSEDSISQDSRSYGLGSDGMEDNSNFLPPPAKSDPNVLKSLRLFRPNLKRPKANQSSNEIPSKVFIASESISNLNQGRPLTAVSNTPQKPTAMNYGPIFNNGNFAHTSAQQTPSSHRPQFSYKPNLPLTKPSIPPLPYESFSKFSNLTITPLPFSKPAVSNTKTQSKSSTSKSKLIITPVPKEMPIRTNPNSSIDAIKSYIARTSSLHQKSVPSTSKLNSSPPSYDKLFAAIKDPPPPTNSNNMKKILNDASMCQFFSNKVNASAPPYKPMISNQNSVINYAIKDTALDMTSKAVSVQPTASTSKLLNTSFQPKSTLPSMNRLKLPPPRTFQTSKVTTSCESVLQSNNPLTISKNFNRLPILNSNKTLTITPLPKVSSTTATIKSITTLAPGTVIDISPRSLSGNAKLTVVDVTKKSENTLPKNFIPTVDSTRDIIEAPIIKHDSGPSETSNERLQHRTKIENDNMIPSLKNLQKHFKQIEKVLEENINGEAYQERLSTKLDGQIKSVVDCEELESEVLNSILNSEVDSSATRPEVENNLPNAEVNDASLRPELQSGLLKPQVTSDTLRPGTENGLLNSQETNTLLRPGVEIALLNPQLPRNSVRSGTESRPQVNSASLRSELENALLNPQPTNALLRSGIESDLLNPQVTNASLVEGPREESILLGSLVQNDLTNAELIRAPVKIVLDKNSLESEVPTVPMKIEIGDTPLESEVTSVPVKTEIEDSPTESEVGRGDILAIELNLDQLKAEVDAEIKSEIVLRQLKTEIEDLEREIEEGGSQIKSEPESSQMVPKPTSVKMEIEKKPSNIEEESVSIVSQKNSINSKKTCNKATNTTTMLYTNIKKKAKGGETMKQQTPINNNVEKQLFEQRRPELLVDTDYEKWETNTKNVEVLTPTEGLIEKTPETITIQQKTPEVNVTDQQTSKANAIEKQTPEANGMDRQTSKANVIEQQSPTKNLMELETPKENSMEQETFKENSMEQETFKENSMEQETFKENSVEQQAFKENTVEQQALKENAMEQPVEENAKDQQPLEESAMEQQPLEENVMDQQPLDENLMDQQPLEENAVDQQPLEENAMEQQQPFKENATEQQIPEEDVMEQDTLPEDNNFRHALFEDLVDVNDSSKFDILMEDFNSCLDRSKNVITFASSGNDSGESRCLQDIKFNNSTCISEPGGSNKIDHSQDSCSISKTLSGNESTDDGKCIDSTCPNETQTIEGVDNFLGGPSSRSNFRKFYHKTYSKLTRNKMRELIKKHEIKNAKVVLQRLVLPENYKRKFKLSTWNRFLSPMRTSKRKIAKSENKTRIMPKDRHRNNFSKAWPLQDINPKVNRRKHGKSGGENAKKIDEKLLNSCVLLKRIDFDKEKKKNSSVLANVPGLNDLQMIRPSSVDRIVQVVQVPGSRCTTSVPVQSTQTSTQVTPHIQRIGQPRIEKPERSVPDSTSTTNTTSNSVSNTNSTAASDSPTLINILSQQIIRPSNQNNTNAKPRSSPLINILSQQIIKPATSTSTAKTSSSATAEIQVNSIPRVISGGEQILSQLINPVRAPVPTLKTIVSSPTSDQNRIVQFICKASDGKLIPVTSFTSNKVVKVSMTQTVNSSTTANNSENGPKNIQTGSNNKTENSENLDILPKFQQAFGKPTYQNNVDSSECVVVSNENATTDSSKSITTIKTQTPKNSTTSLNVQPVQGGVIYTRQMPVAQTINLLPPGRGQVFRIATSNSEQLSLVKDSVIHGKMSALLAAALQGKQRTVDNESENNGDENSQTGTKVALTTRPMLVQSARIVKPVLQIPTNVIRSTPQSNLSSTTLEQLREFDMVYKQVKERSSGSAPTESSPQSDSSESPQQISVTYLNQNQKISCAPVVVVTSYCNVQSAASPSLSVTSQGSSSPCVTPAPTLALAKVATKSPKPKAIKNTTTHASKASPIPKPQQKPQEDEHTTQRIFDILAEYAEQLRNSPDLNNKPAPRRRSNPPTNPNQNAKRKKSSSSKKSGHCSSSLTSDGDMDDSHTVGSEDSSCGVVQISMQEDEQPATVSSTEVNEASASPKQLIVNDTAASQPRSLVIADTNVGGTLKMSNTAVLVPGNYIMPVSMVKGGQQIAVVSGGSKILATVPARAGSNMLLFQSFLNQTKKTSLPTLKYSTVQPISSITRSVANVTTTQLPTTTTAVTNQNLTAVSISPTIALQKVNQIETTIGNQNFDTELLLTIARPSDSKSTIIEDCQTKTVSSTEENAQNVRINNSVDKTFFNEEKSLSNTSVATSVIAQSISIKDGLSEEHANKTQIMALNLNSSESDKDTAIKVQGRVQSVLVTTGTSNGPMLSHSPPTFDKQSDSTNSISESNKDEYLHNDGKRNSGESKSLQNSVYSYQGKIKKTHTGSQRLDRDLQHLTLQRKQAALERELHLQKSLSEECEDLGVDEPSTSDLFPEADLLFDSNHSPSFDQCSQDVVKRNAVNQEMKEENKAIGLFCDDEPMRSDFLFEPMEYQNPSIELEYDNHSQDTKRQICASNEGGFLCEDNTLLQTCTTMSDVTIPSPISPDPYTDSSPPHHNKCKFKYSNRKKVEKSKQTENWPIELSSSEDTTGSTELKSCSRSSEDYSNKLNQNLSCDDDLYSYAIVERLKDDEECEDMHCKEVVNCPSGRGARRSVKKLCPCCKGTAKVVRKRLASRPTTPFTQKKTVFAKKR